MSEFCTLPFPGSPSFSCDVERIIWLARNQERELVQCWWIGFEFAEKGLTWERTMWRIKNGI
jgi:hypothetical protein